MSARGVGDDHRLAALTAGFLQRTQDTVAALVAGDPLDLAEAAIFAHRLRGAGGAFGYPALGVLAGQVQGAAEQGDEVAARRLLLQLRDALAAAREGAPEARSGT